jgi:tRNA U34 5-carboxymethylaminomethyl modifying enzyme MnmG/GidA
MKIIEQYSNFHPEKMNLCYLLDFLKENSIYNAKVANMNDLITKCISIDIKLSKKQYSDSDILKMVEIENQILMKFINKINFFTIDIFDIEKVRNNIFTEFEKNRLIEFYKYYDKQDFLVVLEEENNNIPQNISYDKIYSTINDINNYFFK